MELPIYGEVVKTTDETLYPVWRNLVIIYACKQLLKTKPINAQRTISYMEANGCLTKTDAFERLMCLGKLSNDHKR